MERNNIFADEVIEFGLRILPKIRQWCYRFCSYKIFEACNVPNGRIQPYVKKFPWCIGNFEAEIRRISRNIPLLQTCLKPFLFFIGNEIFGEMRGISASKFPM